MTDTPSPNPALPDREAKKHADRLRIMLQQGGETWLDGDAEAALQAAILALSSPSGDNAALVEALEDVANPLARLKRIAESNGQRLGSEAYSIANSLSFVQGIAQEALNKHRAALASSKLGGAG